MISNLLIIWLIHFIGAMRAMHTMQAGLHSDKQSFRLGQYGTNSIDVLMTMRTNLCIFSFCVTRHWRNLSSDNS